MKKVRYSRYGAPEVLRLDEAPTPDPARGEVRVRVKAASFNPMDGKIRRGEMKALSGFRFPRGLGHDFAGVVDAVGSRAQRFKAGDEVFGVTSIPKASAFAEYVVADEKNLGRKPPSLSFEHAARRLRWDRRAGRQPEAGDRRGRRQRCGNDTAGCGCLHPIRSSRRPRPNRNRKSPGLRTHTSRDRSSRRCTSNIHCRRG
jgi:hypothetical protein